MSGLKAQINLTEYLMKLVYLSENIEKNYLMSVRLSAQQKRPLNQQHIRPL
jgi:hypothetical protein